MSRPTRKGLHYTDTGLSPTMAHLSRCFSLFQTRPGPRSLATTNGVSIDVLSSGYLDVSIPRVRFLTLCIQVKIPLYRNVRYIVRERKIYPTSRRWVSPFRNHRIKGCSRLPGAYRRVPRLSSPLTAKTSPGCPFDA